MYTFNRIDQRLQRLMEASIFIFESFAGLDHKYEHLGLAKFQDCFPGVCFSFSSRKVIVMVVMPKQTGKIVARDRVKGKGWLMIL